MTPGIGARVYAEAAFRAPDLPAGVNPRSDYANAIRFARNHGAELRYTKGSGWLTWDGTRWNRDASGAVMRKAKDTIARLAAGAVQEGRHDLAGWAAASCQRARLEAMLALAESELPIAASDEAFDRNPMLFNTASGVVDLKTGGCSRAQPSDNISKLAPVFYDEAATCPRWLAFLDRVLGHDLDLLDFVQRTVGYSLTGLTTEQAFFVLWGVGANGKSTFLETLRRIFGDYANHAQAESFEARPQDSLRPDLARLRGARFVTVVETREGTHLNEPLVKAMTGGEPLVARHLYREPIEFVPQFKLFLASNSKPEISTDQAVWRRVRLVPFNVVVPPEERIKGLVDQLMAEASGILRWAVEGCLSWQKIGLAEPAAVLDATATYQQEQDALGEFVEACCLVAPGLRGVGLYGAYADWAKRQGLAPMYGKRFAREMARKGYPYTKGAVGGYDGIGLRAGDGA